MTIDKLERNNQKLDAMRPAHEHRASDGENPAAQSKAGIERNARARYAVDIAAQLQAYVDWAIKHWPGEAGTLDISAFNRSFEDLRAIQRSLGDDLPDQSAEPTTPGATQFVPVTPMPWP